ncbi:hypothetical protein B2J93_4455 [Marssonina coronariae]|uniref:Uncharacterized protein n=1 Tax=Diplocarpon coronariae TaxID=2795749 RepID=A0A218Z970_9HELO|nr:hypothetical protein B2J93_4455 [Marssonina coronariae]
MPPCWAPRLKVRGGPAVTVAGDAARERDISSSYATVSRRKGGRQRIEFAGSLAAGGFLRARHPRSAEQAGLALFSGEQMMITSAGREHATDAGSCWTRRLWVEPGASTRFSGLWRRSTRSSTRFSPSAARILAFSHCAGRAARVRMHHEGGIWGGGHGIAASLTQHTCPAMLEYECWSDSEADELGARSQRERRGTKSPQCADPIVRGIVGTTRPSNAASPVHHSQLISAPLPPSAVRGERCGVRTLAAPHPRAPSGHSIVVVVVVVVVAVGPGGRGLGARGNVALPTCDATFVAGLTPPQSHLPLSRLPVSPGPSQDPHRRVGSGGGLQHRSSLAGVRDPLAAALLLLRPGTRRAPLAAGIRSAGLPRPRGRKRGRPCAKSLPPPTVRSSSPLGAWAVGARNPHLYSQAEMAVQEESTVPSGLQARAGWNPPRRGMRCS